MYVHPPASSLQRTPGENLLPPRHDQFSLNATDRWAIDPLFDCLDNLCEFLRNAGCSGFKDVCSRLHVSPSYLTPHDMQHIRTCCRTNWGGVPMTQCELDLIEAFAQI